MRAFVYCGIGVGSVPIVREPGTRIFSPRAGAGLSVTIGHYWYLFKGLRTVFGARSYRFEHIVSYSSDKVVAK